MHMENKKLNTCRDLAFQPADVFIGQPPFAFADREFQGIPGIARTKDGALWVCWYGGGKGEGPDNFVMMATKSPNDDRWSEPWLYVVSSHPELRVFDPTMWVDPEGKLWLFWAQTHVKPENNCVAVFDGLRSNMPDTRFIWDGRAGVWGTCCEQPETEPRKWSEPRRFCDGIMMNKPTADEGGNWLLPTTIWDLKPYADSLLKSQRGPGVAICSDGGHSARMMGTADIPDAMFDEHVVLPLRDGRWAMWVRNASAVRRAVVSYSSDEGQTWTRGVYTDIPCPNSRFFIGRLKSGALLLISHRITQKMIDSQSLWPARSHLAAWVSDDDGQTWQGDLLIDERENVSYPDVAEAEDGTIHLVHDYNRNLTGDIVHVELTEQQIREGQPGIKRSLVNQFKKG